MKSFLAIIAFVLVSLLLMGCGDVWIPDDFPVHIYVEPEAEVYSQDIDIAAFMWNDAVGADVFVVHHGEPPTADRRVYVRLGGSKALATAEMHEMKCDVLTGTKQLHPDTFVHELGHCLGWREHDEDPTSIMNALAWPDQQIKPQHVEYVRQLMGL